MNMIATDGCRTPIQTCLEEIHARHAGNDQGAVAGYIPELSKADPDHFGICAVTADGRSYAVGDVDIPFTIQSISKALVFGLALQDHGRDAVMRKVGVEPSGEAFNAILFDERANRPFNPMVNAGAIATAALVKGDGLDERLGRVLAFMEGFAGRPLLVDEAVFQSERATGHRNRAIAFLELNFGMIDERVDEHLDVYFKQCSVLVTARDLGVMAATLANNGVNPLTGRRAIDETHVKHVVAVMSTCGMYDYAGEWLYRVGLPAKSGVGGGILAVLPSQLGIGTFSPRLDARGNSLRGIKVCEDLSERFGLHMFDAPNAVKSAVARQFRGDQVSSKRIRRNADVAVLAEQGQRIVAYELRGDFNFATTEHVVRRVAGDALVADHLLLDCKRIGNVDPPAADLLVRQRADLAQRGCCLRLAALPAASPAEAVLQAAGWPQEEVFDDLDAGLEWAEDQVLAAAGHGGAAESRLGLSEMQILRNLSAEQLAVISGLTMPVTYPAGAVVFPQGGPPDRLYFLAQGRVSVHRQLGQGRSTRLSTIGAGLHFGEMALLDGAPRSAEVRADTDLLCHTIDIERLRKLEAEHPAILTTLLVNIAVTLSDRLRRADQAIQQLEV